MQVSSRIYMAPVLTTDITKAAQLYRSINHTLRRQILQLLHKNKRMTVTQIYKSLKLEQSVTSQHLSILRNACIVHAEKDGRLIFYSVNYKKIKELHTSSESLLKKPQVL
jgi:DNA-binding transcriptional ArsR family regulator